MIIIGIFVNKFSFFFFFFLVHGQARSIINSKHGGGGESEFALNVDKEKINKACELQSSLRLSGLLLPVEEDNNNNCEEE